MIEGCACGGYIPVLEGQSVEDAVRSHNATATHLVWRRRREDRDRDADRVAEEWRHRLARLDAHERDPMTPELFLELAGRRR